MGEGWRFLFRCRLGCRVRGVRVSKMNKLVAGIRHEGRFPLRCWRVGISSVERRNAVPVGVCFSDLPAVFLYYCLTISFPFFLCHFLQVFHCWVVSHFLGGEKVGGRFCSGFHRVALSSAFASFPRIIAPSGIEGQFLLLSSQASLVGCWFSCWLGGRLLRRGLP